MRGTGPQVAGARESGEGGAREAAAAIEDRLEGLIAFLGERLPKEGASAEVDDKLASFHRTVLKMANFDEIAIAEITKLDGGGSRPWRRPSPRRHLARLWTQPTWRSWTRRSTARLMFTSVLA